MKYSEFFEYEDIVEKSLNSDKLAEYTEKLNIPPGDAIMYLSITSSIASSSARKLTHGMLQKKLDPAIACNHISLSLSQHIFDKVDFFSSALNTYNSQFGGFNKLSGDHPNPYIITQKQFQDYLSGNTPEEPQENIEQYLKVMSLSNKASKILSVFRDYNTLQSLDIANSINKKNYRSGNPKRYSTYKRDYIETYNSIATLANKPQENGIPLKVDFLNTYLKYIKKELSEKELRTSQAYTDMVKLFANNNPHNCYISPASLYKNLSFGHTIDTLYLTKNLFFKKAFREYSELSKTKDAYKYRVTKNQDDSIGESFSGNCYSTNIHFVVRGYNAPFSLHQDPNVISDLENKYGISIEEGYIPQPFVASYHTSIPVHKEME